MTYRYRVFGLTMESSFPIPELIEDLSTGFPDVTISVGMIDEGPGEYCFKVEDGIATLWVPDADAAYRIVGGRELVLDARGSAIGREQRLFLLGSALGGILHQRGLLPLHGCALEFNGKAVAFLGRSGAGKSTLAAWLRDRGGCLLSDDVCVVEQVDRQPCVSVGIPRLRLWRDAVEARGGQVEDYPQSFRGMDKYDVPATPSGASDQVQLSAIFHLVEGATLEITPLRGAQAVECLAANTYRGSYVRLFKRTEAHFQQCIALAGQLPMSTLARPKDFSRVDEDYSCILEQVRQFTG